MATSSAPARLLRLLVALCAVCGVGGQGGSSVCSAATTMFMTFCPGEVDTRSCDPGAINIGDEVTLEICIKNESYENCPAASQSTDCPGVDAQLKVNTEIAVRMMCQGGRSTAPLRAAMPQLSCIAARAEGTCTSPMFEDVFVFQRYTSVFTGSSYAIGGLTNCNDPNACGKLTLTQEVRPR